MKKIIRILASVGLFAFGLISTAVASNISKTFEFGPGTQNPSSNVRTYPVPCGRQVAAVVKFKRLGPAGTSNDIPIKIEFREPDTAPNQEGPIIETKSANAKTTEQSVTIFSFSGGSSRGCTLPWRVRVKYANPGTPPFAVTGTSRLDYDGRVIYIPSSPIGDVNKSSSKTVNFGDVVGLKQGTIAVAGRWTEPVFVGDLKLRFELINPSGAVVKTAEGYSNEDRTGHPKLYLVYQVPTCIPGQWKLKVINTSTTEGRYVKAPEIKFTPGCP